MDDYTVVDTIVAYCIEEGDTIRYIGKPMEVKGVLDLGDTIVVSLADEFGEVDEFPLKDDERVDVLAFVEEEVHI